MKNLIIIMCLLVSVSLQAQKVDINPTITPDFFAADQEITITYDVTGTSMQDWDNAWIWLWIPNTSISTPSNINPASSNSTSSNPAKFTKTLESGRHLFSITLTLTDFTSGTKDEIKSVGMLIKGNDWGDGQSEDYVTEITDGFILRLESPEGVFGFYTEGAIIDVVAKTSSVATIEVYIDNILILSNAATTSLSHQITVANDAIIHELLVKAYTDTETSEKSFSYALNPSTIEETVPAGMLNGINYGTDDSSVTLVLHAPNKQNVFVIGDFNDWSIHGDYLMKREGDRYWLVLNGLTAGTEYRFQYLVDGEIRIADPYTEKIGSPYDDNEIISDGRYPNLAPYPFDFTQHAVSYLQTAKTPFNWTDVDYVRPAKEDLIIYELLVRDFTDERTYNAVTEKLDYLKELGINAIHIMPVTEFEGNLSWGYNPAFMMAADKYYGTEQDLKNLINEAHNKGIAIILDQVLNHAFGRSSLARLDNDGDYGDPTSSNVWLNRVAKHPYNVGYDFNHESEFTQAYVDRVNAYWIEEYHIDGYRFDLSKGFTQKNSGGNVGAWGSYDASRIALLKRMADEIWKVDSESFVILEHFSENTEEKELANYGMMLWGNFNGDYSNLAKGFSRNLGSVNYKNKGWDNPHLIAYMESHDEERTAYNALKSYDTLEELIKKLQLNTVFFLTIPGPKMIWQFGEMGYDLELNNDRLGIKPTKWEYLEDENRKKLFDVYTSLANLKTKTDYIKPEHFVWSATDDVKWININHPEVQFTILGNFGDENKDVNAHFTSNGTWYNYFTGQAIEVTDFENHEIGLFTGQFAIYTSELIENYIDNSPLILDVKAEKGNKISVYPNPSHDFMDVKAPSGLQNISVIDMMGKVLINKNIEQTLASYRLDISALDKGIYIIEAKSKGIKYTQRIIKK